MLQYMLCVSRFAHYLKVAARDKIGSFTEAEDCEDFLHRLAATVRHVRQRGHAGGQSPAIRSARPAVRVRENPGKPGSYLCVAHLWPHFELDELSDHHAHHHRIVATARRRKDGMHGRPP